MKKQVKIWVEAIRLRTLPVSLSGVLIAIGFSIWTHQFRLIPSILCIVFALLAQVISNLANEYYDFKNGIDKKGRAGFRRGVTEGDIKPKTERNLIVALLSVNCLVGLLMLFYISPGESYRNWLLCVGVGVFIAIFALAYSAGPYPLSHHALGEPAVFVFFGIIPVIFTYYVIAELFNPFVIMAAICIGLMGVNVLLINNYRDVDDDREAGKKTSVVVFGRKLALTAYLFNGFIAISFLAPLWFRMYFTMPLWTLMVPVVYIGLHVSTWLKLRQRDGAALNPLLGETARNMLIFTILLIIPLMLY